MHFSIWKGPTESGGVQMKSCFTDLKVSTNSRLRSSVPQPLINVCNLKMHIGEWWRLRHTDQVTRTKSVKEKKEKADQVSSSLITYHFVAFSDHQPFQRRAYNDFKSVNTNSSDWSFWVSVKYCRKHSHMARSHTHIQHVMQCTPSPLPRSQGNKSQIGLEGMRRVQKAWNSKKAVIWNKNCGREHGRNPQA